MSQLRSARCQILVCILLIVAAAVVYWQAAGFELVNLDDDYYVATNPAVLAGLTTNSARWAFTTSYAANWHPLTWLSLAADTSVARALSERDVDVGTDGSAVYHVTNVLLHIANTLLLFALLARLTGCLWRSAFVAALFAVHPLHVESVAWVTERKDVLSAFFGLLAMLAYARYVTVPRAWRYVLVLLLFALSLMSKPMLVSLPILLLLLDYWPLGRLRVIGCRLQGEGAKRSTPGTRPLASLVIEKIPLIALSAAACVVTVWAQGSRGSVISTGSLPFGMRAANAVVAYAAYLGKAIWPARLACIYPHPGDSLPVWMVVACGIGLVAAMVLSVRLAKQRPYLVVGWLWFVITLIPVIGLVQVGKQAMADRYAYVPLIGVFIIAAWGLPDLVGRIAVLRRLLAPAAVGLILAYATGAHQQTGYWQDSATLMTRAVDVTERNSVAHNNLGEVLFAGGDTEQAEYHFRKSVEYHPEFDMAHYNLGTLLGRTGRLDEAEAELLEAHRSDPTNIQAVNNLGMVYLSKHDFDRAAERFRQVLELAPEDENARRNLELAEMGRARQAP